MSLTKRLLKLITSFDQLGDSIIFTINKEKSPKSMMGGIISSILMILIVYLFIEGVLIPLRRFKPSFNFHYIIEKEKAPINLSLDTMPFAFAIRDTSGNTYYDRLALIVYLRYHNPITDSTDWKYFNLTDCPKEYFSKFDVDYEGEELNIYKCIDNQNLNVTGGSYNADTLRAIVVYCDQDTVKDDSCDVNKKKTAFKKDVVNGDIYFSIKFINNIFNPKIYKPPVNSYVDEIYTYIDNYFYKETNIQIADYTLITDDGLLLKNEWNETLLASDKIERDQLFANEDENTLIKYRIWKSDRKYLMNRSYTRVQSIIAETLGLYSTISFIAKLLFGIITTTRFNVKIMNQIFEFDFEKSIETKEIKTNNLEKVNNLNKLNNTKIEMKSTQRLDNTNIKLNFEGKKSEIYVSTITENVDKNINQQYSITRNALQKKSKRETPFRLTNSEIFYMILLPCCVKNQRLKKKFDLYKMAREKMKRKFEITYVMKILEEVEKLKTIVLPEKEISFFESVAKELCSLERNEKYSDHRKIKTFKNNKKMKTDRIINTKSKV